MLKMAVFIALILGLGLALILVFQQQNLQKRAGGINRVRVGVIRYDPWTSVWNGQAGNPMENLLADPKWQARWPWFAKPVSNTQLEIREDSQDIIDQENQMAASAGINYWAFLWADTDREPNNINNAKLNYGVDLFRSSQNKAGLNYLFILQPRSITTKELWPSTVNKLATYFKDANYEKFGDRPIIHFLTVTDLRNMFGSWESASAAVEQLRQASIAAGAGNPYVVGDVGRDACSQDLEEIKNNYGFVDSLSGYGSVPFWDINPKTGSRFGEFPYSYIVNETFKYFENCKATGKKFIPTFNVGFDQRPVQGRYWYPADAPYFTYKTVTSDASEIADTLNRTLLWIAGNSPTVETNSVLIYAWNEWGEGGWLAPAYDKTIGDARLKAIKEVLVKTVGTEITPSTTGLEVVAQGTAVNGVYPHVSVILGDNPNGPTASSFNVSDSEQSYQVAMETVPSAVIVKFDNDAYAPPQDRNLQIKKIRVNGKDYLPTDSGVEHRGCGAREWQWCNGYVKFNLAPAASACVFGWHRKDGSSPAGVQTNCVNETYSGPNCTGSVTAYASCMPFKCAEDGTGLCFEQKGTKTSADWLSLRSVKPSGACTNWRVQRGGGVFAAGTPPEQLEWSCK